MALYGQRMFSYQIVRPAYNSEIVLRIVSISLTPLFAVKLPACHTRGHWTGSVCELRYVEGVCGQT